MVCTTVGEHEGYMAKTTKRKKVEKVVITKEHYEALELLAQYGSDLLENRPPALVKGATLLGAAACAVDWAEDIERLIPTDKKVLRKLDDAMQLFFSIPNPEKTIAD